ncbi:MAG TPA: hypothetical protein VFO39_12330 [Candidatus Sulfotelmatobacter sp.]|nr:hypothetical protein [Candidatus Sulfotelmatobacter sp.]
MIRRAEVLDCYMPEYPDSFFPTCPICGAEVKSEGRARLECPGCRNTLVVHQSRLYRIFRTLAVYGTAAVWAWKRGWEPSFIVFVVSFYAIPVLLFLTFLEAHVRRLFPPKRFDPQRKYLQTLGI